jgi:5-methylcytosine-specific restriction endonuclease McrA
VATHKWLQLSIWKRTLQPQIIQRDPICGDIHKINCMNPSTQVHHIVPYQTPAGDSWELFTSYSNLIGLCASCHARQTVIEQKRVPAKTKNAVPEGMWSSSAYSEPTAIKTT